jgi:hypothetical protein
MGLYALIFTFYKIYGWQLGYRLTSKQSLAYEIYISYRYVLDVNVLLLRAVPHNEEFHGSYVSLSIVRIVKSKIF